MIRLVVHGHPRPQGSKKGFIQGEQVRIVEAGGEAHRSWREAVRSEAQDWIEGCADWTAPLEGPVVVEVFFFLPKPASAPKRKRTWPIGARSGDLDKLGRCVADALTGVLFRDDSQIVQMKLDKDWGVQPGAFIEVREVEVEELAS